MTLDGAQQEAQRRADTLGKTYAVCLPTRRPPGTDAAQAFLVLRVETYTSALLASQVHPAVSLHTSGG